VAFGGGGGPGGGGGAGGKNPPRGVQLRYHLAEAPEAELTLELLDDAGEVLRGLSSTREERRAPNPSRQRGQSPESTKLPAEAGMNEYVWDLRLPDAEIEPDAVLWGSARGPEVPPGTYQARLSTGDWSSTVSFEVQADPRLAVSQDDLVARYRLARRIWEGVTESHRALHRLRSVRTQVGDLVARLEAAGQGGGLAASADAVTARLTEIEEKLHQVRAESSQDVLNFPPKLDNQWIALLGDVASAEARPTAGELQRYEELRRELDALLAALDACLTTELAAFEEAVAAKGQPAVIVPKG
jgi:hypothetical protein